MLISDALLPTVGAALTKDFGHVEPSSSGVARVSRLFQAGGTTRQGMSRVFMLIEAKVRLAEDGERVGQGLHVNVA